MYKLFNSFNSIHQSLLHASTPFKLYFILSFPIGYCTFPPLAPSYPPPRIIIGGDASLVQESPGREQQSLQSPAYLRRGQRHSQDLYNTVAMVLSVSTAAAGNYCSAGSGRRGRERAWIGGEKLLRRKRKKDVRLRAGRARCRARKDTKLINGVK